MAEYVIKVENVSKSYRIGHQQRERYMALRDVLSNGVKGMSDRLLARLLGRAGQGASMRYEEFWALNNLSFDVKPSERVGIIGHNGAGKSTLLKILSRISEPTTGRVAIRGRVACLLEVGTGFHPELTGSENVYLNGAILGMSRGEIRRKFDEIVAFAEVEKFLDTPVKHYSSGLYVRLAFAVAAHLEPEILLVDEVLAVGDVQFQKKCLGKMQSFAEQEQRTVVFVSHNMEAIRTLCTKVVRLERGEIAGIGPVEKEVQEYLHPSRPRNAISPATPFVISVDLAIHRFAIMPVPVISGAAVEIELVFYSTTLPSFSEIAILLYSDTGIRVAVIDLRRADGYHRFDAAGYCTFRVAVNSLPLVEGGYYLGLYLRSTLVSGNFLELTKFTVEAPAIATDGVLPYPSQYRGLLKLDYTFV